MHPQKVLNLFTLDKHVLIESCTIEAAATGEIITFALLAELTRVSQEWLEGGVDSES